MLQPGVFINPCCIIISLTSRTLSQLPFEAYILDSNTWKPSWSG
uniref:Uncharacterized protein n=1 Tax=Rhizophora mucronata TaxID=61149 RepID=A0A2P2QZJ7_RHIMU